MSNRLVLVTGGNRGIGLEVCRQLASQGAEVILTSRDETDGHRASSELARTGGTVHYCRLDVTSEESIKAAAHNVERQFGRLDTLVNNAGIHPDHRQRDLLSADLVDMRKTMEVNAYGPLQVTRAFVPLLQKGKSPRVINVSSGMAQLNNLTGSSPAYRLSKVMLNMFTRVITEELDALGIRVNAVAPGWVRTDMGGPSAPRSVEEGADAIAWLAAAGDEVPTGGLWHDRQRVEW